MRGRNRDNPADRRRAAQEVLVEWQREHPEAIPDPEDYRRVIDGFVPSGGNESRPDLLAPKPGVAHPVQASESGNGPAPYGTAATREAAPAEVGGGRERFLVLRAALAVISSGLTDEQGHLMPAGREEIGQLRAKPSGGKVCQAPDLIERLIGRAGGDDAFHGWRIHFRSQTSSLVYLRMRPLRRSPRGVRSGNPGRLRPR